MTAKCNIVPYISMGATHLHSIQKRFDGKLVSTTKPLRLQLSCLNRRARVNICVMYIVLITFWC